jgi:hypothetical protein
MICLGSFETPSMKSEDFSTEAERNYWVGEEHFPDSLITTINALQEGLKQNATNLITMHQELSSCWLIIAKDLKKIEGKQAVHKGQVEGQAAENREHNSIPVN